MADHPKVWVLVQGKGKCVYAKRCSHTGSGGARPAECADRMGGFRKGYKIRSAPNYGKSSGLDTRAKKEFGDLEVHPARRRVGRRTTNHIMGNTRVVPPQNH